MSECVSSGSKGKSKGIALLWIIDEDTSDIGNCNESVDSGIGSDFGFRFRPGFFFSPGARFTLFLLPLGRPGRRFGFGSCWNTESKSLPYTSLPGIIGFWRDLTGKTCSIISTDDGRGCSVVVNGIFPKEGNELVVGNVSWLGKVKNEGFVGVTMARYKIE